MHWLIISSVALLFTWLFQAELPQCNDPVSIWAVYLAIPVICLAAILSSIVALRFDEQVRKQQQRQQADDRLSGPASKGESES